MTLTILSFTKTRIPKARFNHRQVNDNRHNNAQRADGIFSSGLPGVWGRTHQGSKGLSLPGQAPEHVLCCCIKGKHMTRRILPYARTTMTELDAKLARFCEVAQGVPLAVDRHNMPYVWVIGHPIWYSLNQINGYLPASHPLKAMKETVDAALYTHWPLHQDAAAKCKSSLTPGQLFKCWFLHILYSFESEDRIIQHITYNLLFRWFIDYEWVSDPLPETLAFEHDIRLISKDLRAAELARHCLASHPFGASDSVEFRINHGLLHHLKQALDQKGSLG